ncbi:tRNA (N6-threonylcarbamoyladenosine(37)-N6)-methyltransferase TrmO [Labrenzia sp. 011]|uniref:tRNA (N6-threonylcarbamoyladenosine(37)-N6)-methyltransferase TrmO n=1 Tax=Labrenzia sp. 011 TaxID=2171494 RepID=UPI000D519775|nr:tRNA (N6-threonylcarbamoyladenosine(37)-N6)-methyltransferase TrmO [Labrenzia sp. 011]PVB62279.1 tRNA (N6-threonylcarbamoyladenosine(37)-N6)-methyltransferase TrmO [Labrenzia sp. 011]
MNDIRAHEVSVQAPEPDDARLRFIGRIHTPWTDRKDCPHQGKSDGPECRIEIFEPWVRALEGIETFEWIEVLYWLDKSRRDLVIQNPGHRDRPMGTFALRSPVRPNPIGTVSARLVSVEGASLIVRGLDCLNGTPLIDLKPDRCMHSPKS